MLKNNSTHTALKAQETQPKTIEFALPSGPHWSPKFNEYEIWLDGEVIGYARSLSRAWDIYHSELEAQRVHFERCPDDSVLWRRNGYESHIEKAPVEPATALAEAMVIIHSAGGVTIISRNGEVSYGS